MRRVSADSRATNARGALRTAVRRLFIEAFIERFSDFRVTFVLAEPVRVAQS